MSVLLPSPCPPQIMPLIINRMRACSSWKAGTGTSLLNRAAQLGLKLFNRNMKAPSVRRTRPSEVTACRPSPASTPLPAAWALLPLFSSCPIQQGSPCATSSSHTSKLLPHSQGSFSSTGSPSSRTPLFHSRVPFSPLLGFVSSLTPSQSQPPARFSFPCNSRFSLCTTVCPWAGLPYCCPRCRALWSRTP